jgi:hypothetical protein
MQRVRDGRINPYSAAREIIEDRATIGDLLQDGAHNGGKRR